MGRIYLGQDMGECMGWLYLGRDRGGREGAGCI
jgi:hypothetical protein